LIKKQFQCQNEKTFIRDGRAPIPINETVSRVMSSNKNKNTKPEMLLRHFLWHHGIRGYRLNLKNIPGRPDICFPGKKVAIFVHGCFWHRCPCCALQLPKTHTEFWSSKFLRNEERDARTKEELENSGWRVVIIWECQIKKDLNGCLQTIKDFVQSN
jgi:DNA mismatch endonuclease (patch repair protein)